MLGAGLQHVIVSGYMAAGSVGAIDTSGVALIMGRRSLLHEARRCTWMRPQASCRRSARPERRGARRRVVDVSGRPGRAALDPARRLGQTQGSPATALMQAAWPGEAAMITSNTQWTPLGAWSPIDRQLLEMHCSTCRTVARKLISGRPAGDAVISLDNLRRRIELGTGETMTDGELLEQIKRERQELLRDMEARAARRTEAERVVTEAREAIAPVKKELFAPS